MKTESNLRWPTYRYDERMDGGKMDRTLSVELFYEVNDSHSLVNTYGLTEADQPAFLTGGWPAIEGDTLRIGSTQRPIVVVLGTVQIRGTDPIPDMQEYVWKMHEQLNTLQWRHVMQLPKPTDRTG